MILYFFGFDEYASSHSWSLRTTKLWAFSERSAMQKNISILWIASLYLQRQERLNQLCSKNVVFNFIQS